MVEFILELQVALTQQVLVLHQLVVVMEVLEVEPLMVPEHLGV